MIALVVSLLLLFLGPLLLWMASRQRALLAWLDGFVLFAVGGLVCLDIVPHAAEQAGWWVFPLALAGLFIPTLFERLRKYARRAHAAALVLGMVGIVIHALVDGIALSDSEAGSSLILAVVLHRLPVGVAAWWLIRPAYGRGAAWAVLGAIAATTVVGFVAGESWRTQAESEGIGLFTALVAGSLLHVLLHVHGPVRDLYNRRGKIAGAFGALFGAGVVALSIGHVHAGPHEGHSHADVEGGFFDLFHTLAEESSVALVIAYLAAGLVFAYLPSATVAWLGRGGAFGSSVRGLVFALPIPICSCGVIPIYKGLIERGAPMGAAMALLVAAPELGIDAVLLSVVLLDVNFAIARVIAAALLALLVGWGMGRLVGATPASVTGREPPTARGTGWARLRSGLRAGFVELVDDTAPWILLGLAIAAVAWPLLAGDWLAALPAGWEIPVFALLGMPVYVCASGATPIAAVLVAQGVGPGAALAFLLTGPATNITTFGVLSQLHGRRIALTFALAMAIGAVGLGLAVDGILGPVETTFDRSAALEAQSDAGANNHDHANEAAHAHGSSGTVGTIALGILALLFLASLFRQGPRGFVGQVMATPGEPATPAPPGVASAPGDSGSDCY